MGVEARGQCGLGIATEVAAVQYEEFRAPKPMLKIRDSNTALSE